MGAITGADVTFTLAILPLFPIPQRIMGFASDDVSDVPSIRSVEVMMGVDGVLSSGFVNVAVPQHVALQADSLSNRIFETWWTQMQSTKSIYRATGFLSIPGIATNFVFTNGSLTGYKPMPAVKKLLQQRSFELTWEKVVPVPA
jgi:hypothetical protein